MSKYSFEFKKKVVNAYINGEGGYNYLSEVYGIPSQSNIEKWVHNYQVFGDKKLNLLKYMHLYYIIKNKGKDDEHEFLGL